MLLFIEPLLVVSVLVPVPDVLADGDIVPAAPPVVPLCEGLVVSGLPLAVVVLLVVLLVEPVVVPSSRRWHAVRVSDAAAINVMTPN
ncbi:MAG TPA: hypothetical protein VJ743_20065 [Albitalea sp.]|nr:hypothetical protein [Albitalea sp.]